MVVSWPVELPDYMMVDGYDESPANNLLKSQTDTGPGKTRRRQTSAVRPLNGSVELDHWQVQRLDQFYEVELKSGALPFERKHPRVYAQPLLDDGGVTYLTDDDGNQVLIDATILVKFSEPPRYNAIGGVQWRVTLSFEILP